MQLVIDTALEKAAAHSERSLVELSILLKIAVNAPKNAEISSVSSTICYNELV